MCKARIILMRACQGSDILRRAVKTPVSVANFFLR